MPRDQAVPPLAEFLSKRPGRGGSSSWCCHVLPPDMLAQIEALVVPMLQEDRAPNWSGIAAWLVETGVDDATVSKVQYHFQRGHHRHG